MITKPTLILADEPTGSLDNSTSHEIMDILEELNTQGTAILIVTHDNQIANRCKSIVEMKDGIMIDNKLST